MDASDCLKQISNQSEALTVMTCLYSVLVRGTIQIWALVLQTSFRGETVSGVAKCSLFLVHLNLARQNRRHFPTPTTVSPRNDVWETSAEIPYWWRVTAKIWLALLIGRAGCEICFNQSEALPRCGLCRVISLGFLRSFLRRHFAGKPSVAREMPTVFSG